jgi:hypothetical protein
MQDEPTGVLGDTPGEVEESETKLLGPGALVAGRERERHRPSSASSVRTSSRQSPPAASNITIASTFSTSV